MNEKEMTLCLKCAALVGAAYKLIKKPDAGREPYLKNKCGHCGKSTYCEKYVRS